MVKRLEGMMTQIYVADVGTKAIPTSDRGYRIQTMANNLRNNGYGEFNFNIYQATVIWFLKVQRGHQCNLLGITDIVPLLGTQELGRCAASSVR